MGFLRYLPYLVLVTSDTLISTFAFVKTPRLYYLESMMNLQRKEQTGMLRLLVSAAVLLVVQASANSAVAQVEKGYGPVSQQAIVTDHVLGISFLKIGKEIGRNDGEYKMSLQNPGGSIGPATAGISVTPRRFVDLSGSFGGRLYLDEPSARSLMKNRAKVDTVEINGVPFTREYWTVYAGIGQWEGVISCYAFRNGQYYELSLNVDCALGKPGEVVDGKPVSADRLKERLAQVLNDRGEPVVKKFNELLSSFQFSQ